ncbi:hypothetical protein [Vibrio sp. AND4]|uniref:hypothetical protein n=1 Tax=Vibrio sp. AND4 TaxID=314289 RepID=UPI00015F35F7|nr:hypothetical protein [Vibrio sp. AND4]EDP59609.1 hypothetical protein AND4_10644 [Vibrio sp. AND4]
MKILSTQHLNDEDGIASIEAIFTIPIIIYIFILIAGFFQYVGNESVLNYNITRAVQLFDYSSIEKDNSLDQSKANFLKVLNEDVNRNYISINSSSLNFRCFKNVDDLAERTNEMDCSQSNINNTNLILISFDFDYKSFSQLFSTIYPSAFLGMERELVIVNEIY